MVCIRPETGRLLPWYELGLLEPEEAAGFEAHLFDCPDCFERFRAGARAMSGLRDLLEREGGGGGLWPAPAGRRRLGAPAPDVSVLIPCRNSVRTLDRLAASLEEGVPRGAEILFLDDGSTDGSFERFRSLVPGARCFRQESRGVGATRNRLAALARGEFLQLLDADDAVGPGKIEAQVRFARQEGLDVVFTDWRMVVTRGEEVREEPVVRARTPADPVEALLGGWWFAVASALVRRESFLAVGGCDPSLGNTCDDFDLWVRLAIAGARFGHLPGYLGYYYRDEDRTSVSRADRRDFFRGEAEIIRKALDLLRRRGELTAPRRRAAARRLHRISRNVFDLDRDWHRRVLAEIRELDASFRPGGPALYRLTARFLGLRGAERVASARRRWLGRGDRARGGRSAPR